MYSVGELLAAIKEMSPSELRLLSELIQIQFSVTVEETKKEPYYDFWRYYHLGGYNVILNEQGTNKVKVIKALREYRGLGLREAKELVDYNLPTFIKKNCEREEAYTIQEQFEALGALVSLEEGYIYDPLPEGYSYD